MMQKKRIHRPVKPLEAGFTMEGDVKTMQEQLSNADIERIGIYL